MYSNLRKQFRLFGKTLLTLCCLPVSFSPPQHLDRDLKDVNTFIRADSRISASPIMKLLFGDPRLFLSSLPPNSRIHHSTVWSCREKVSLLSLTHIVEQNGGKDTLPVLWRFLHKVGEQLLNMRVHLKRRQKNPVSCLHQAIEKLTLI